MSEKIQLGFTDVTFGDVFTTQYDHLFILYTDKNNQEFIIRGGPYKDTVSYTQEFPNGSPIDIVYGKYSPLSRDWIDQSERTGANFSTLIEGSDLSSKFKEMIFWADTIENSRAAYFDGVIWGDPVNDNPQNSNTLVFEILNRTGTNTDNLPSEARNVLGYMDNTLDDNINNYLNETFGGTNNYVANMQSYLDSNLDNLVNPRDALINECFPANTLITLSNGTQKPIADIRIGDEVLAFDAAGRLHARKVTKLFTNVTEHFYKLSSPALKDDLVVTSGHRFVREDGSFETIEQILREDSKIILENGAIAIVSAETLVYNAETAHLFEQITLSKHAAQGALAAKPQEVTGWKTYTFEVEELHSYEAANDNTLIRRSA